MVNICDSVPHKDFKSLGLIVVKSFRLFYTRELEIGKFAGHRGRFVPISFASDFHNIKLRLLPFLIGRPEHRGIFHRDFNLNRKLNSIPIRCGSSETIQPETGIINERRKLNRTS